MTDEGRPTLTYFDMRGRAEAIRLLFTDQGIVFMDRRIRSAQSWQALQGTLPLGRLPHYTDPAGEPHRKPSDPALSRS